MSIFSEAVYPLAYTFLQGSPFFNVYGSHVVNVGNHPPIRLHREYYSTLFYSVTSIIATQTNNTLNLVL